MDIESIFKSEIAAYEYLHVILKENNIRFDIRRHPQLVQNALLAIAVRQHDELRSLRKQINDLQNQINSLRENSHD